MSHDVGQQKIIIDVDEEITTVIDQLRFVRGNDVGLVVPQRAVILQSVMNLKLLAQEAQRMRKKIVIITRDNDGMVFAQRAGIATQSFSVDEEVSRAPRVFEEAQIQKKMLPIQREREVVDNSQMQQLHQNSGAQVFFAPQQQPANYSGNRQLNVDAQGSNYHSAQNNREYTLQQQHDVNRMMHHKAPQLAQGNYKYHQDVPLQRTIATQTHPSQQTVRGNGFDIGNNNAIPQRVRQSQSTLEQRSALAMSRDMPSGDHEQREDGIAQYERSLSEARIDHFSSQHTTQDDTVQKDQSDAHKLYNSVPSRVIGTTHASNVSRHIPVHDEPIRIKNHNAGDDSTPVSSRARLLVKGLFFGAITLVAVIIFIIIAPKTKIMVTPKNIVINDTVEITARIDQTAVEGERRIVPARVIERDITFTKSFSATGKGDVNAQKAQGTITIYNTFDDKPQSLVASTRFLAENGMLFRLVKTTTIPGMKNGEPGKVEALVIADKDGAEGNIAPTRFSIPGFDGSSKKEKFYAISEKEMAGGGTGGNGVALVSEDDIVRAQKEMEVESKQYIQEQLTSMIRPESEVLLPEAIISEITRSEPSVSAQTMSDQFMYEIVAHVYAMAFVQEDASNILTASVDIPDNAGANDIDMRLLFDNVQMDRENGMMRFSVHGNAELVATVVIDDFKKDIAGTKHDDLRALIENRYRNTIEKITIESVFPQTPGFLGEKISRFEFMTHVSVGDPER